MTYDRIPTNTFKEIQMNAAMILSDFTPADGSFEAEDQIGATTGGITFTATQERTDLGADIDNCPKNMKELMIGGPWTAKASGTYVTMNTKAAKTMLGAADVGTTDTTKITPRNDILDADFDDIWIVGDYSDVNTGNNAGYIAIHLKNALSTGGFQIKTQDKGKGQFSFEYTAHYSMAAQTMVPFEIYIKAGASIGALTVTSVEGTNSGDTAITVTPAKASGNTYRYKVDTAATSVTYGMDVSAWDTWDGSADITADTGKVITVVEADSENKAVKAGNATVVAKGGI